MSRKPYHRALHGTISVIIMTDAVMKDLPNKLKQAREKLGLTQVEVAEKAGINVNGYAKIERGETQPKLETVKKLMSVLKIKPADVL